jgi:dienelactone hydrolase
MRIALALFAFLFLTIPAIPAAAEIVTKAVAYDHNGTALQGHLAYDDSQSGKRPAVLLVHAWRGLGSQVKDMAQRIVDMGYVAFCLDMYGSGILAKDNTQAKTLSRPFYADRKLMRARAKAGLMTLQKQAMVDPQRIAVIGFCFGGSVALEMARDGQSLAGAASFHGGLKTSMPASRMACPVLVLHGAADPLVKPAEVAAFMDEMRKAKADWQLVHFSGAMHSFTDPKANSPERGVAYDAKTDRRSFAYLEVFLAEIFGK